MRKLNHKIKFLFLTCSAALFLLSCGNQPLFDRLAENQVKVIIKGTYESNDPRPWAGSDVDESVYVLTDAGQGLADTPPARFMLDIASLEIDGDSFANYRETYTAGLDDNDPFFNGTGVSYKNDDMTPKHTYNSINMFLRKMIFDNAKDYRATGVDSWEFVENVTGIFEENKTNGYNFNLAQVLTYFDFLKVNYLSINRIFPLNIRIEDGFVFDPKEEEQVLEIRLVIKNFVSKYEYEFDDDGMPKVRHFYALSDWLREVKRNEPAVTDELDGVMGGNVLAVARSYTPGKTVTITGNVTTPNRYVAAIRSDHDIAIYSKPTLARPINIDGGLSPLIYDEPKAPRAPLSAFANTTTYIEALLQYYLEYEVYKANFDDFVDRVADGSYETQWNNYESSVSAFRIPPMATYAPGLPFSLTNVPVGVTYNIYESEEITDPAILPSSYNFLETVTVSADCAGKTIDIADPTQCN